MKTGIIIFIVFLSLIVMLAGFCADYTIMTAFGADLPTWADCCIGMLCGGLTIPSSIICVIVKACGVPTPFFAQP
jgi:hypothetical protein